MLVHRTMNVDSPTSFFVTPASDCINHVGRHIIDLCLRVNPDEKTS